ncbi:MAG: histidine--tRNA ligase [Chloroflexi bacterium]|nr:histidine--tRNA ligase [Chloroflexota bacterium]
MAEKIAPRVPRGMRDILPQKMILRQYVMGEIRQVFESFGFEPLETPTLELWDTLMGKYGPEAEKLIYEAQHVGGKERLALRYDLSVPLARVVAQYPDLPKPFRRYQIAPVWRAERPQRGRYREFYQCDVDVVGSPSMLADAEVINIVYEALHRLGFRAYTIHINHRKLITGLGQFAGVPQAQLGSLYRAIDKMERIGVDGVREELLRAEIPAEAADRLLALLQTEGDSQTVLQALRAEMANYPVALQGLDDLAELIGHLEALEIPQDRCRLDVAMVRGLEYYTGPVFETTVDEPRIGSITGGGRYDELVGLFTQTSLPATGTSLGIERIIDVMDELKMYPPSLGGTVVQVLVAHFGGETLASSLQLTQELRRAGWPTEIPYDDKAVGDQVRYALKKGIPYVAIIGPDELQAGTVALRNLQTREQVVAPRAQVIAQLLAWKGAAA